MIIKVKTENFKLREDLNDKRFGDLILIEDSENNFIITLHTNAINEKYKDNNIMLLPTPRFSKSVNYVYYHEFLKHSKEFTLTTLEHETNLQYNDRFDYAANIFEKIFRGLIMMANNYMEPSSKDQEMRNANYELMFLLNPLLYHILTK